MKHIGKNIGRHLEKHIPKHLGNAKWVAEKAASKTTWCIAAMYVLYVALNKTLIFALGATSFVVKVRRRFWNPQATNS